MRTALIVIGCAAIGIAIGEIAHPNSTTSWDVMFPMAGAAVGLVIASAHRQHRKGTPQ